MLSRRMGLPPPPANRNNPHRSKVGPQYSRKVTRPKKEHVVGIGKLGAIPTFKPKEAKGVAKAAAEETGPAVRHLRREGRVSVGPGKPIQSCQGWRVPPQPNPRRRRYLLPKFRVQTADPEREEMVELDQGEGVSATCEHQFSSHAKAASRSKSPEATECAPNADRAVIIGDKEDTCNRIIADIILIRLRGVADPAWPAHQPYLAPALSGQNSSGRVYAAWADR